MFSSSFLCSTIDNYLSILTLTTVSYSTVFIVVFTVVILCYDYFNSLLSRSIYIAHKADFDSKFYLLSSDSSNFANNLLYLVVNSSISNFSLLVSCFQYSNPDFYSGCLSVNFYFRKLFNFNSSSTLSYNYLFFSLWN